MGRGERGGRCFSRRTIVGTHRRRRRSPRVHVSDSDPENPAVPSLQDRCEAVAGRANRHLERPSPAIELPDLLDAAHHIDMREGAAAILASRYRRNMPAIETDQQEVRGKPNVAPPQPNLVPSTIAP